MKTKSMILSACMLISATVLSAQAKKQSTLEKIVFHVSMDCEGCKTKIEKNIAFEKGVKNLEVDLKKQTVAVTFDKFKTNVPALQAAFKKIGFEAKLPASDSSAAKKQENCSHDHADACKTEQKTEPKTQAVKRKK